MKPGLGVGDPLRNKARALMPEATLMSGYIPFLYVKKGAWGKIRTPPRGGDRVGDPPSG